MKPHQHKHSQEETARRSPIELQDLMRNAREVEISHEGQIYRLRITRNRKLILTK